MHEFLSEKKPTWVFFVSFTQNQTNTHSNGLAKQNAVLHWERDSVYVQRLVINMHTSLQRVFD